MKAYLSRVEFIFILNDYGEVKVIFDATGEFNKRTRSMYFKVRVLKNGEHPKIGQKSLTDSSYPNKTNALRLAKQLLK